MEYLRKFKSYVLGEDLSRSRTTGPEAQEAAQDARAFSQKASVPRHSGTQQPVLQNAGFGSHGGVQGLTWYTSRLREDCDGDVADEFFEEQSPVAANRLPAKCEGLSAPLQVKVQDLKRALPGDVIVHEGDVHIIPPER
ncbi:hypothetical protein COCOBI_06-3160 [Coccomyxa sp. Obi]|nr:hypothetical protein COCOBI_06-3160 [Coccomyxa sp. Obi]